MRRVILLATLAALTQIPLAHAQPQPPAPMVAPTAPMGAPAPDNCGTPDEPKACPPLPRRALKHYHANKQSSG
jgi:hypothetical protein